MRVLVRLLWLLCYKLFGKDWITRLRLAIIWGFKIIDTELRGDYGKWKVIGFRLR